MVVLRILGFIHFLLGIAAAVFFAPVKLGGLLTLGSIISGPALGDGSMPGIDAAASLWLWASSVAILIGFWTTSATLFALAMILERVSGPGLPERERERVEPIIVGREISPSR